MTTEHQEQLSPRIQHAVDELQRTISQHYPSASFQVARSVDEPENIHLLTTVDLDDADEVLDLVIDRVVELQVEERIPLHVIPLRTPERIRSNRATRGPAGRERIGRRLPLFERLPVPGQR